MSETTKYRNLFDSFDDDFFSNKNSSKDLGYSRSYYQESSSPYYSGRKFYSYGYDKTPSIINPSISYWDKKSLDSIDIESVESAVNNFVKSIGSSTILGTSTVELFHSLLSEINKIRPEEDVYGKPAYDCFPTSWFDDSSASDEHTFANFLSKRGITNIYNHFPALPTALPGFEKKDIFKTKEFMQYFGSYYDYLSHCSNEEVYANSGLENTGWDFEQFKEMVSKSKAKLCCAYLKGANMVSEDDIDMMKIDLYKNFYNKEIEFDVDNKNSWWFNTLSNIDNYMIKMITNGSQVNSKIVSEKLHASTLKSLYEYAKYIYETTGQMPDLKEELSNQGGDGNGGEGEEESEGQSKGNGKPNSSIPDKLSDIMNNNNSQAMDEAMKEINEMNDIMSSLGVDPGKASSEDIENIKSIVRELDGVRINKSDIEKFVKSSIKSFNDSFRGKKEVLEENFFEAEDIEDFSDFHLLSNECLFDDMSVTNSKYSMKYDIYIDCSGSMGGSVKYGEGEMSRIVLAKILAYKMDKMNLLGDIYGFETHVYKVSNIMNEISANGGTHIDSCIKNISLTNRPSIILSDGDDSIKLFDPNAFLFTICSSCRGEGLAQMIKQDRAIHYQNGNFYKYELNAKGHPEPNTKNSI